MLNGLYSAGSAMDAATRRHELISQNLAHAQMPGYRRQMVMHSTNETSFDSHLHNAVRYEAHGVKSDRTSTDFTPGPMERTNHPLDVAIQGSGFFEIQGPNGPLFTRNGAFQLDSAGTLVTADMLPVEGGNGAITLPPNTPLSQLQIQKDGTLYMGAVEVGKLKVVNFADPQRLQQAGITLFSAPRDMPPHEFEATVFQNMRERANVSPMQELIELIAAQRQQEAAQRSMTAISEAVGKNINAQGR